MGLAPLSILPKLHDASKHFAVEVNKTVNGLIDHAAVFQCPEIVSLVQVPAPSGFLSLLSSRSAVDDNIFDILRHTCSSIMFLY
jgi:hypothetical protein